MAWHQWPLPVVGSSEVTLRIQSYDESGLTPQLPFPLVVKFMEAMKHAACCPNASCDSPAPMISID